MLDALSDRSLIIAGISIVVAVGSLILYGILIKRLRPRLQAVKQEMAEVNKRLETEQREMALAAKEQALKIREELEKEVKLLKEKLALFEKVEEKVIEYPPKPSVTKIDFNATGAQQ